MLKWLVTPSYIFLYYTSSISLSLFTSYMLSEHEYNFRFPLFIAAFHNFMNFLISFVLCIRSKNTRKYSIRSTLLCSVTGALDLGLSSYSLRKVDLAFYTMVKSSSPIFILLCGFVLGVEKPSILTFLTIFLIGSGIFLVSLSKVLFNLEGLLLILLASFMSGFRWSYIQFLLADSHVLHTICDLSLPMSLLLFAMCAYFEGFTTIYTSEFFYKHQDRTKNIFFITISGMVYFTLLCSELLVVSKTSVLFLSIAGIAKELIVIFYSVLKNNIALKTVNYLGIMLSSVGIITFNLFRRHKQ